MYNYHFISNLFIQVLGSSHEEKAYLKVISQNGNNRNIYKKYVRSAFVHLNKNEMLKKYHNGLGI